MKEPSEWDTTWADSWVGEEGEAHLPHPLVITTSAKTHGLLIKELKRLQNWHEQHGIHQQTDWGIVGWRQVENLGFDVELTLGYREVQSAVLSRMMWT
ncbi:MAG: hypothetical protein EOP83_26850 [Verrucomicrobiaceae bacterium]|nr:MAG: hypothetical protein EOP83_26850 [Verrucomicrobiaceae bacterium]